LAHLDQMDELLVGDNGTRPVRHHDSEVLGKLEAQAAAVLWMLKNSKHKGQVREEEEADGEAKSQTSTRRAVLKDAGLTPHLRSRARCVSETFAHARAPAKQSPICTTTRSPRNTDLPSLRAVMMERSRRSRRPKCPRP
jgi:hypothetical protein